MMRFRSLAVVAITFALSVNAGTIDHDKVQPIPQPEPVTTSEKAGVKFKPQLTVHTGCDTYAAANAEGETTGGLKGNGGNSGCKMSVLGSQVYGRAAWHNDLWAIMYAWYFPKGFWRHFATSRHDWANVVVWIDNPSFESPKLLGLSTSDGDDDYDNTAPPPDFSINGTTPKVYHALAVLAGPPFTEYTAMRGVFHDLIMWDRKIIFGSYTGQVLCSGQGSLRKRKHTRHPLLRFLRCMLSF